MGKKKDCEHCKGKHMVDVVENLCAAAVIITIMVCFTVLFYI